jgi:hypothetical protein
VACCEIYTLKSDRCKKANVKFNKKRDKRRLWKTKSPETCGVT